jgi:disulfide bond formation protein DsbB
MIKHAYPDWIPLLVAFASITALVAAFVAEYGFDLQPCVLCLYQRWPYGIAIVLALLALSGRPPLKVFGLACAATALTVGAGIAAFHVGVEQGWWQGTAACSGTVATPDSIEELRKQLMAAPVVRCDEPAFVLFGISMAGYNFMYALALAVIAAAASWHLFRRDMQA